MDKHNINVIYRDEVFELTSESRGSVHAFLQREGFYIPSFCASRGTCGKCRVLVKSGGVCCGEGEMAAGAVVLACRSVFVGDATIEILSPGGDLGGPLAFLGAKESSAKAFTGVCVAVDIGTTTVCVSAADMDSGEIIGIYHTHNSQRIYGADLISRIEKLREYSSEMRSLVLSDILNGIRFILADKKIQAQSIKKIAVVGNPVMLGIFLAEDCSKMGVSPFTLPARVLDGSLLDFFSAFGCHELSCPVHALPALSSYIGADALACAVFTDILKRQGANLIIDIGTNGEILLFAKGKLFCASAAAGPALEGGGISCGMGGVYGAVCAVCYDPDKSAFTVKTVGDSAPVGICGSGAVDAAALFLRYGIIDESGLLSEEYFDNGVEIAPGVILSQSDIRQIQMAKSAIRAGIDCLLSAAGIGYSDTVCVYLAGGLGTHAKIDSLAAIGLLPPALAAKTIAIGNAALGGALRLLRDEAAALEVSELTERAVEIRLADNPEFAERFIEHMGFCKIVTGEQPPRTDLP